MSELRRVEEQRQRLTVLVTVFNDWAAFEMLLDELAAQAFPDNLDVDVVAVDDASRENHDRKRAVLASSPLPLTILTLARNVGNQRAIAIGLSHIVTKTTCNFLVVMDGDGEDRPSDVPTLVKTLLDNPNALVTAQRQSRSEVLMYKVCYIFFKTLFRSLTGTIMNFGNFSAMSFNSAEQLCSMHELLLSYPATMLSSRIPMCRVPIDRGNRYMGRSGITYLGLAVHGLSSIAVFSDRVLARMLVACAGIFGVGFLAIVAAVIAKVVGLATPGWATTVVGFTLAVLIESAVAILSGVLIVLNSRQAQSALPPQFADRFIRRIDYSDAAKPSSVVAARSPVSDAVR
jgi:polyisoprenyl-phosphate glycosyltransferase